MTSGNYLVGKDLSMSGFELYVQSELEQAGYSVPDKLQVTDDDSTKILVSLVGEDTENSLNDALVKAVEKMEKENKGIPERDYIAWKHQVCGYDSKGGDVGKFDTLGTYSDDATASSLFSELAHKYLLAGLDGQVDEFKGKLGEIGHVLSELD